MPDISEMQECIMQLRPYLESLFSNRELQNYLLSRQMQITLAEYPAGRDSHGRELFKRFVLTGNGAREEVECEPFDAALCRHSCYEVEWRGTGRVEYTFRFDFPNAARSLAYRMAKESGCAAAPAELEKKIQDAIARAGPAERQLSFNFED